MHHWTAVLLIALFLAATAPARAQSTSGRERGAIAGWALRYSASASTIQADTAAGLRVIDLERVANDQYDVTYVANTGVYANGNPQVYFGLSETSLLFNLNLSQRRILDVEAFDTGLYAATAVDNSGAANTPWSWIHGQTSAQIFSYLAANPTLRPIDIDRVVIGGVASYSMVTVSNTGAHQRPWWLAIDRTTDEISAMLAANNARLVDLEVTSTLPLRFACIMVSNDGVPWWWYPAATAADVDALIANNGARPIHVQRYTNATGSVRYACIMVNNSNDLTFRVGQMMRDRTDGHVGCFLKQVGGPVLASLNATRPFEPASTLKILYATRAIDRIAAGADALNNIIENDDTCNPDECPDQFPASCNPTDETVAAVLRRMMQRSDNNATREVVTRFGGHAVMSAYAASTAGMTDTRSVHNIGCPGCPLDPAIANRTTLTDIGAIFERIADGSLFGAAHQDTLYDLMEDSRDPGNGGVQNPNGAYESFRNLIVEEAAQTSLTADEITSFTDLSWHVRKPGGYTCTNQAARAMGGWARIPFRTAQGIIASREYVLGTFVNDSTLATESRVVYSAFPELLRDVVREALQSWDSYCAPPVIVSQPDDQSVLPQGSVSFRVRLALSAGQAPTTFQWHRGNTPLSDGPHPGIGTISGSDTGTLAISGAMATAGGQYSVRVSRSCGVVVSRRATLVVETCAADFNADGELNSDDLSDFITCYFLDARAPGRCPQADFNADGARDADDLSDFVTAYFLGC